MQLPPGDAARGADLFQQQCARCHSTHTVDRTSSLFRAYPRLDCADYRARASTSYLVSVISKGGAAVGLDDAMKPFAEVLTPGEIADVVTYLQEDVPPHP